MAGKQAHKKFDGFDRSAAFDLPDDFGDEDGPEPSPGELAATFLSLIPPPALMMIGAEDKLPALLVALDPQLSLAEVNKGLDKYEDLLITMLAEVRAQRREITHGPGCDNLQAPAATIHGREAIDLIEQVLLDAGEGTGIPGFDGEDMRRNLKVLKSKR